MELSQILKLSSVYTALALRANPYETLYFTLSEFVTLCDCNLIVDIGSGGLLLAPPHDEGGINLLVEENGVFRFKAEIEGWEYLINTVSTGVFKEEIEVINAYYHKDLIFQPYEIPNDIKIIDANPLVILGSKFKRYLINRGGAIFIVNKHATKRDLHKLDEINEGYL